MHRRMFESLDTEKRSLFVARQILEILRRGVLKVGDRLPTEKQICEETGVSRPCVREAVVALELLGIVERRAGAGTFIINSVETPTETELLGFLSLVFREGQTPLHILEARQSLEYGAFELGWDNLEPVDLETLSGIVDKMEAAVEAHDVRAYFDLDMQFHRSLIELSKNPVVQTIMNELITQMNRQEGWVEALERYTFNHPGQVRASFEIHRHILESLKKGDKDGVLHHLKEHYNQGDWWRRVSEMHAVEPAI